MLGWRGRLAGRPAAKKLAGPRGAFKARGPEGMFVADGPFGAIAEGDLDLDLDRSRPLSRPVQPHPATSSRRREGRGNDEGRSKTGGQRTKRRGVDTQLPGLGSASNDLQMACRRRRGPVQDEVLEQVEEEGPSHRRG